MHRRKLRVGMPDRGADLVEQAHALVDVERAASAAGEQRFAVDVFHGEPRAALADAGIDERGDVRMGQCGEDVEAPASSFRATRWTKSASRRSAEMHAAHAAFADLAQQAERADVDRTALDALPPSRRNTAPSAAWSSTSASNARAVAASDGSSRAMRSSSTSRSSLVQDVELGEQGAHVLPALRRKQRFAAAAAHGVPSSASRR